jgi:hypothetical protein
MSARTGPQPNIDIWNDDDTKFSRSHGEEINMYQQAWHAFDLGCGGYISIKSNDWYDERF